MNLPLLEQVPHPEAAPRVPLGHLDDLWFQVSGTRCNLACHHCFISCHPHNHSFGFLSIDAVEHALRQSLSLGVKEYYFTGGEPFLHPEIDRILERALAFGPTTVLTNGTLFTEERLARLRRAEDESLYSLEFRVSLDGISPETNDPIRGHGTFERILSGVKQLVAHDFLPILTVALTDDDDDPNAIFDAVVELLKSHGYSRPRIKILPTLRLGAEVQRQRGYRPEERVTPKMLEGFDVERLLCRRARVVTDRGIAVCPILIEAPGAHLGVSLAEAQRPAELRHPACYTCYCHGAVCSNPSSGGREV